MGLQAILQPSLVVEYDKVVPLSIIYTKRSKRDKSAALGRKALSKQDQESNHKQCCSTYLHSLWNSLSLTNAAYSMMSDMA